MEVLNKDIENLKKIQDINTKINNEISDFEKLPEKTILSSVNANLSELNEKYKKIIAMRHDVDKRFETMELEEASLLKRQESVQKSIDEDAGDFRNLEAHTKELNSISSRMSTLSEMMLKVAVEQEKVDGLDKKLTSAISQLKEKKEVLEKKLHKAKLNSTKTIEELTATRDNHFSSLPSELAKMYEDAVAKVGNIVLASLEGDSCSVCRTQIEEGKLFEIRKSGGVSTCPVCGRIIIVED